LDRPADIKVMAVQPLGELGNRHASHCGKKRMMLGLRLCIALFWARQGFFIFVLLELGFPDRLNG